MGVGLVDCHCHLSAPDFDSANVMALVVVAEHSVEFENIMQLSESFRYKFVLPCLGVHPVQGVSPEDQRSVILKVAPEEDERKRRRGERNKIAAAKCRKEEEKTECLQKESEKLESINAELKTQIEAFKNKKQHLIYMLKLHRPTCIVWAQNGRTPEDERNLFIQQIKEGTLQS